MSRFCILYSTLFSVQYHCKENYSNRLFQTKIT